MKRNIFKKSFLLLIGLICLSSLSISKLKTTAASSKFYYINASIGETYDQVGINYHADLADSYVLYATNSSLTNAQKVVSTSTEWEIPTSDTDSETGFAKRYVCQANLVNLAKETTYYYQVVSGSEKSDIYSFLSGTDDTDNKKSFMVVADIHAYQTSLCQKTQAMMTKVLQKELQNKVKMIITAGDNVDRGGYQSNWDALFTGVTSFKNTLWATIPGNHEYYHDNGTGYISPYYYNQFFNNPQNGPTERVNSSYYFKYGNALFIMLDTINREYLAEQQAWFKETVYNNPSPWIIVVSHPGCYSGGSYAHDAQWMIANWAPIFEECQVDLALSGHEHVYARKDTMYKNEFNETLGVTYQISPAAGMKQYAITGSKRDLFDEVENINYSANVITLSGYDMIVKTYTEDGTLAASYTIKSRRPYSIDPATDDDILNSITSSYDKANNRLTINWGDCLWGNVKSIKSSCKTCVAGNWEKGIVTTNILSYDFGTVYDSYDYYFDLTLTKYDGTTLTKTIEVINIEPIPIELDIPLEMTIGKDYELKANQEVTWTSADESIIKIDGNKAIPLTEGRVYLTATAGKQTTKVRIAVSSPVPIQANLRDKFTIGEEVPFTVNQDVTITSSDETILSVNNYSTKALKAGTVTLTLSNGVENKVYNITILDELQATISETSLIVGNEYTVTSNQTVTWTSDNERVVKVENGKVIPLKAGSATLTVTNGLESKEFNITITEPAPEPDPEPAPKKGCKKKASLLIVSIISLSSVLFILRKKK